MSDYFTGSQFQAASAECSSGRRSWSQSVGGRVPGSWCCLLPVNHHCTVYTQVHKVHWPDSPGSGKLTCVWARWLQPTPEQQPVQNYKQIIENKIEKMWFYSCYKVQGSKCWKQWFCPGCVLLWAGVSMDRVMAVTQSPSLRTDICWTVHIMPADSLCLPRVMSQPPPGGMIGEGDTLHTQGHSNRHKKTACCS